MLYVQVGLALLWRYSSQDGNCVEVARNLPGVVVVRDSKDQEGLHLVITREVWRAFIRQLGHE